MRDLGTPTQFLGIDILQVPKQNFVTLSQHKYILKLAQKFQLLYKRFSVLLRLFVSKMAFQFLNNQINKEHLLKMLLHYWR